MVLALGVALAGKCCDVKVTVFNEYLFVNLRCMHCHISV